MNKGDKSYCTFPAVVSVT